ncbi:MAG: hypothetical protein KDC38_13505, partial [Planctomycetes bacterium]|nr:hypothetical protein [Planctomycetota bacterium]
MVSCRFGLGLLVVVLVSGCLKEDPAPPTPSRPAEPTTPSKAPTTSPETTLSATPTAPGTEAGGSAPGNEIAAAPAGASIPTDGYHPSRDPLVNPADLFQSMPDDPSLIDTEATLLRNMDGNPASLNPLFGSSTYEFYLNALLFDGLFTFDKDMEWQINESMVEEFEESADHKIYRVTLREGLKWHDGVPFTADDIVFSYENIMDDRVPCPSQRTGTDELETVRAVSPRVVEFVHKTPLPTSKWNVLFSIVPKHIYEVDKTGNPDLKSGPHNNKYNRAPIGNGPYKFVRWDENDKIVLER